TAFTAAQPGTAGKGFRGTEKAAEHGPYQDGQHDDDGQRQSGGAEAGLQPIAADIDGHGAGQADQPGGAGGDDQADNDIDDQPDHDVPPASAGTGASAAARAAAAKS